MSADAFRCPLCHGARHALLRRQVGLRMASAAIDERLDVDTHLCLRCGIVLTHPQPSGEVLERFYATQHRDLFVRGRAAAPPPGAGSRRDQVRWLEERLGDLSGRRVLEIGCYDGYLLHLLAARGARVTGVEPSRGAAAHARARWGVDVHACTLEAAPLAAGGFDVVVLSHVLEHLRDPRAALGRCWTLLAPGGAAFVEVPNVLEPRVESAVDFFTFDHLFHFSPRTLAGLGARSGFATRAIDADFPFPAFRWLGVREETPRAAPGPDRVAVAESRAAVTRYDARRRDFVAGLRDRLARPVADWRARAARVVVYGAGAHTEHLLRETDLARAPLVAFVDGHPDRQGSLLHGLPVHAPERLAELAPDAVLISSYDFQEEMAESARRLAPPGTPILTCYERTTAFSTYAGPAQATATA